MPFYLKDHDLSSEIAGIRSALIVPCRFCPAATLAVRTSQPYLELFRTGLETAAYRSYIEGLRSRLEDAGVKTEVYSSGRFNGFVVCMWTAGLRKKLAERAARYDAVIALGCDAAVETVKQCTASLSCKVIAGMEIEGIMNVIPSFRFPGTVSLAVTSVIRVLPG